MMAKKGEEQEIYNVQSAFDTYREELRVISYILDVSCRWPIHGVRTFDMTKISVKESTGLGPFAHLFMQKVLKPLAHPVSLKLHSDAFRQDWQIQIISSDAEGNSYCCSSRLSHAKNKKKPQTIFNVFHENLGNVTEPPWRNRLARSAVNRKVGGSSPPGGEGFSFVTYCHFLMYV